MMIIQGAKDWAKRHPGVPVKLYPDRRKGKLPTPFKINRNQLSEKEGVHEA